MICPLKQAYDLHQQWPLADLFIVQGVGHAANEPAISAALVSASKGMLGKLS